MAFTGNAICDVFRLKQWSGGIDVSTATFYLALYTNAATLSRTTTAYTSSGEVAATGYTAGGSALTMNVAPTLATDGTVYLSFADKTFSAALTARGGLIYVHDGVTNLAAAVLDFGADKTSTTAFTVHFPAAAADTAILRIK